MKTNFEPAVTPCPGCNQIGLRLDTKFQVKDPTTVSLAGVQTKLTGRFVPHLECLNGCGWQRYGRTETGYVVFAFEDAE